MNDARLIEERLQKLIDSGWNKLTREEMESVIEFARILYLMQDATEEEKQEIIDSIEDERILKFLDENEDILD